MTLFDAEGWQTDTNTECLNDSLFGQLTAAHKKSGRTGRGTNVRQRKNRNVKQSGKKGPKCATNEEKQTVTSKKSKSHDSSNSRSALIHDIAQPLTRWTPGTKQLTAQHCHEQLEQTRKCESKRKANKRNKYKHLVLNTAKEDVNIEVKPEDVHSESKKNAKQQKKRKRKQTSTDDGLAQKVAKRTLPIDTTPSSETLMKKKKKKKKVKKGASDKTSDCVLEAVVGDMSSGQKRHISDYATRDTETESVTTAPVTSVRMRKNQGEGKRKQKSKTDDGKHSKKVTTLTKIDVDSSSASMSSTSSCVKVKAVATPAAAATAVKIRRSPFNIARLKAVFRHEMLVSANTSNVSHHVTGKDNASGNDNASKTPKNATECKSDRKVATKSSSPQTLREKMQEKLNSARFRYINEQLYRRTGEEAHRLFSEDPETFQVYHEGYQSQIAKWPVNPVNKVIEYISARPASLVVADLGCGDAKVSRAVPNHVLSFDLVAVNDSVTACDISKLPLEDSNVDIAVFCLSLMGTDFVQFLCEANRILRLGGKLLVAEVVSRFDKIGAFVRKLTKLGFSLQEKDTSNKMFVWFEFMKIGRPDLEKLPKIVLMPCVYKKR